MDTALRRIDGIGPLAGGHLFCYLMAQSCCASNRQLQEYGLFCQYEDILGLLYYDFIHQENGGDDVHNLSVDLQEKRIQQYKDLGIWDAMKDLAKPLGYTPVGYIWDGRDYRFVLKGSDEGYVSGAAVIGNIGLRITPEATTVEDCL